MIDVDRTNQSGESPAAHLTNALTMCRILRDMTKERLRPEELATLEAIGERIEKALEQLVPADAPVHCAWPGCTTVDLAAFMVVVRGKPYCPDHAMHAAAEDD